MFVPFSEGECVLSRKQVYLQSLWFFFRGFGKYLGFRLSFLLSFHTMEELASQWNNFSLSEKENANYTISKEQRFEEFILAVEFFTPRFLNMESMA